MRLELNGFAPDVDPATPGVLTDCDAIIPSMKGLTSANSPVDAGLPALSESPTSAYVAELLDGTKRTFAATASTIQEAGSTSWTDRSRVGGYSGSNRMRFCTFGNVVLATNRTEGIQQAEEGAGFEDIADAPLASILVPASGFVVALNINGMTLGDVPDGWGCSAIRNQEDWTPAASTQCVAGRLLDSPGPILAGAALGDDVIAYKATSMYVGRYVGPPLVWSWARVPGEVGCVGAEALVVVGTTHYFVGPDDFYSFDGTVPRPIGSPLREWFFDNLLSSSRGDIVATVDRARSLVYWYFPSSTGGGALDLCITYNYKTDQWGKWAVTIQAAVQYSSGQITYDDLGTDYSTYDDLPNISFDSPFWLADQTIPGVFIGDSLYSLTGEPGTSTLVTGDFGDLSAFGFLSRVTPRFTRKPPTSTATNYYRNEIGDAPITDSAIELSRGRFDFRRAARWHRLRLTQTGAMTINGIDVALAADSDE
jgi:hypothetical protein